MVIMVLPFLLIALIAFVAPLVSELPIGFRLPIVVIEVALGILVGPHMLDFVTVEGVIGFLGNLGLAFLFFLAGLEIDLVSIGGRPLSLATRGWLLSLVLALALSGLLYTVGFVRAPLLVAVALTTTAIGTLLPILRDAGELQTPFGSFILAAGALGEFGPIVLISLLMTREHSRWGQTGFMVTFVVIAALMAALALRARPPQAVALLARTMYTSSQLPVRFCVLLLVSLGVLAEEFGLDMILGAFAAGMVVGLASRGEAGEPLRQKLDAIGFGFFIPIFFVTSGIKFDVRVLLESPSALLRLLVFLGLFLVVRGTPVLLYRRNLAREERLPFALYSATALPLVVAITEIGLATGRMRTDNAAALVGAGMLSVLLFPLIALTLRQRTATAVSAQPRAV
jgi:Kef-type K+ transport system membrane component KefB